MKTARAEHEILPPSEFQKIKQEQEKYYALYWEENNKLPEKEQLNHEQMKMFIRSRIFHELLAKEKLTPFKKIYDEIKNQIISSSESYEVQSLSLNKEGNDNLMTFHCKETSGSILNFNLGNMSEEEFAKLYRKRRDRKQRFRINAIYNKIKESEIDWDKTIKDFEKNHKDFSQDQETREIPVSSKRPKLTITTKK